jgi:membrane carboxypeptidase/penicillin-binding protein
MQRAAVSALSRLRRGPQAALVAVDPRTGGVAAWVGGTDFAKAPFDRAARAHRQPGSTFKTLVMLAALDKRIATEATLLKDEPLMLKSAKGRWSPQNFDRRYRHQVSLWDALVQSLNVPTVALAMQTGLPVIQEYARRAGIVSELKLFPSMALGASEVTLPEMTVAYATLAAGGVYRPPYDVAAMLDADGHLIERHQASAQQAFDPASVFLVTTMLRAVLTEGTGASARALGLTIDAAGKTGTSENFQDAWFVGYTRELACGVWVGYDKPKSLGRSAAGVALPLWVPFMEQAAGLQLHEPFAAPPGIVWQTVDPQTGMLARSGCPTRRNLPFLQGTEPKEKCSLHAGGILGFFKRLWGPKPEAPKYGH